MQLPNPSSPKCQPTGRNKVENLKSIRMVKNPFAEAVSNEIHGRLFLNLRHPPLNCYDFQGVGPNREARQKHKGCTSFRIFQRSNKRYLLNTILIVLRSSGLLMDGHGTLQMWVNFWHILEILSLVAHLGLVSG